MASTIGGVNVSAKEFGREYRLALKSGESRKAFIKRVCGGDKQLFTKLHSAMSSAWRDKPENEDKRFPRLGGAGGANAGVEALEGFDDVTDDEAPAESPVVTDEAPKRNKR